MANIYKYFCFLVGKIAFKIIIKKHNISETVSFKYRNEEVRKCCYPRARSIALIMMKKQLGMLLSSSSKHHLKILK